MWSPIYRPIQTFHVEVTSVQPLYRGAYSCTGITSPSKGHFGASHVVLCREVVLFSEVQSVLVLWERYFEECPLQRGSAQGSFIGGSPLYSSPLLESPPNALSLFIFFFPGWSCGGEESIPWSLPQDLVQDDRGRHFWRLPQAVASNCWFPSLTEDVLNLLNLTI